MNNAEYMSDKDPIYVDPNITSEVNNKVLSKIKHSRHNIMHYASCKISSLLGPLKYNEGEQA